MKFLGQERPKFLHPLKEALLIKGSLYRSMAIIDFLAGLNYSVTVVDSIDRALAEIKTRNFRLYVSDDIYPIKWGGREHLGACFELFEKLSKMRGKRVNFIVFSDKKDIAKACQKFGLPHFKKQPLDRKELSKYLESI